MSRPERKTEIPLDDTRKLVGRIAHDFNNCLNVIIGYAEMLGVSPVPDESWHEDIKELSAAAGRAAMLARRLLAFSHQQPWPEGTIDESLVELERMLNEMEALSVDGPAEGPSGRSANRVPHSR